MQVVSDAKMIGVRCRHPRLIVTYYFVFDGALNKETKVRIMRALVWPVATYGCELWTLKASDKKRIAAFEMTAYRRMLRISWKDHRINQSILEEQTGHYIPDF